MAARNMKPCPNIKKKSSSIRRKEKLKMKMKNCRLYYTKRMESPGMEQRCSHGS